MASDLLTNATADGRGTAVAQTGAATIQVVGGSVLNGPAYVKIMYNLGADTAGEYTTVGEILNAHEGFVIDVTGAYNVLAELIDAQADTDVTVRVGQ